MSAKATFWAWGIELPAATKLVLLSLSNYANDQDEAWPSYETMSKSCGMDRRTVIRHCAKLEDMGLISIKKRKIKKDQNTSNIYKLLIQIEPQGVVSESHHLVSESHQGSVRESPKPNKEPNKENIYTSKAAEPKADYEAIPYKDIADCYQDIWKKKVRVLSDNRKRNIREIWRMDAKHQNIEFWAQYFRYAQKSQFLSGYETGWKADFDFLINKNKFIKIIEGSYHK